MLMEYYFMEIGEKFILKDEDMNIGATLFIERVPIIKEHLK